MFEFSVFPQSAGTGKYQNKSTHFAAPCLTPKEIKELYPAGGFTVSGQVGKGSEKIGTVTAADAQEPVYKVKKMPHSKIKGYIKVGENEYLAVVRDVLLLWLLIALAAVILIILGVLIIKNAIPANSDPTPPSPSGVVDPNAQLGEGEISVPDKIETKGKNIKFNGVPEMNLKAGEIKQNFIFSNPEGNPCYFVIEIELTDTGEILYTSDLLPPGYSISAFNLKRALEAGEYNAIVHYKTYSFDKEQNPLNKFDSKTVIKAS